MGKDSKIEWTDHTLNYWIGCTKVSPACDNCYAEAQNNHRKWANEWGPHGTRHRTKTRALLAGWNAQAKASGKPQVVFVNSLSDIGDNHKSIQDGWREDALSDVRQYTSLIFLWLTKRPQNILKLYPSLSINWPDNLWIGTTIENQHEADRRYKQLCAIPAKGQRFLSIEPLLGPVDLEKSASLMPVHWNMSPPETLPGIGWVIVGGETGKCARPLHPEWADVIREQCEIAGVPFFFKQWGDWLPWHFAVPPMVSSQNGQWVDLHDILPSDFDKEPNWDDGIGYLNSTIEHVVFQRVGKKKTGNLLYNKQWNQYPNSFKKHNQVDLEDA